MLCFKFKIFLNFLDQFLNIVLGFFVVNLIFVWNSSFLIFLNGLWLFLFNFILDMNIWKCLLLRKGLFLFFLRIWRIYGLLYLYLKIFFNFLDQLLNIVLGFFVVNLIFVWNSSFLIFLNGLWLFLFNFILNMVIWSCLLLRKGLFLFFLRIWRIHGFLYLYFNIFFNFLDQLLNIVAGFFFINLIFTFDCSFSRNFLWLLYENFILSLIIWKSLLLGKYFFQFFDRLCGMKYLGLSCNLQRLKVILTPVHILSEVYLVRNLGNLGKLRLWSGV